jgi:hypothetical protein
MNPTLKKFPASFRLFIGQQGSTVLFTCLFYKKVACSPCVHLYLTPPCRRNNICMKNIGVAEVWQALAAGLS